MAQRAHPGQSGREGSLVDIGQHRPGSRIVSKAPDFLSGILQSKKEHFGHRATCLIDIEQEVVGVPRAGRVEVG